MIGNSNSTASTAIPFTPSGPGNSASRGTLSHGNGEGQFELGKVVPSRNKRVPGMGPQTHRPVFTEAKHQRILSKIKKEHEKAGNTPSPSVTHADARADTNPSAQAAFPLGETLYNLANSTYEMANSAWAQIDGMVSQLIPAPLGVAGAEADGSCTVDGECGVASPQTLTPKERFAAECAKNGFSEKETLKIQTAWRRKGIALNEKTAPLFSEQHLLGGLVDRAPSKTGDGWTARGMFILDGEPKSFHVLSYGAPKSMEKELHHYYEATGINAKKPKFEQRNLLASAIAAHLKWDVVPFTTLAYLDGEPCLATETIEGQQFADAVWKSKELFAYINSPPGGYKSGSDIPVLTGKLKRDWYKLAVLALVTGDKDRNMEQFYYVGDPPQGMKGVDWDMSFGKKLLTDEHVQQKLYAQARHDGNHPRWPPSKEFGAILQEFVIDRDDLLKLSDGLLDEDEQSALVQRYDAVMAKLKSA
jgi:hypothetical protein